MVNNALRVVGCFLATVVGPRWVVAADDARASDAVRARPAVEVLWAEGAPGAKGDTAGDRPTLTIHLPEPDKATGAGVVICPGGAYRKLAMDYEGHDVARWFNSVGVAGFVVAYRHRGTGYGYPAPLLDAQRAIRLVRARAADWHVDPHRVGILGFSAGGHLAATCGTHFDNGRADAAEAIERFSCRPDFMILVYPVISFAEPYRHTGSMINLLGEHPDRKLVDDLSNERHVTPQTPPAFLVHGTDDAVVPVENSIVFYEALRKANVPVEMHLYRHGPHGFGLGAERGGQAATWPGLCVAWMRGQGLLGETATSGPR